MTILPGIGAAQVRMVVPIAGSYVTTVTSTGNLSSFTFTSASIGGAPAAGQTRNVVVVLGFSKGGGPASANSVSIGGISASKLKEVGGVATDNPTSSIWTANVPTGTTATIVVSLSATCDRCFCSIYRLIGANPAAFATSGGTSATTTLSLNTADGGYVAAGCMVSASSSSTAWTGLTENYDAVIEATERGSSASVAVVNGSDPLTVSGTQSGTQGKAWACVSFQPE